MIVAPSLHELRTSRTMIYSGLGLFVTNLRQCHLGDDGQHDLLSLRWVRILLVFVKPGFQSGCRLSGGIFSPGSEVSVASITKKKKII